MPEIKRREFLKTASVAGALAAAPPVRGAGRSPNDTIGVAVLGVGTRGNYLLEQFENCPNTEVRAISDLYAPNVKRALETSKNKKLLVEKEWRKAIESKDIDAVVIATPDFWHAKMTVAAAQLGKDVYTEKGLCRTLDEAKQMRKALKESRVVFQLGHQQNSEAPFIKGREIYASGRLGKVPLVRTFIDRTSSFPEWRSYTAYNINQRPAGASAATIDWERFLGDAAPKRPFDVERFFRWRCWWDYGTGIAGDLMSHQWDGVNGVMGMGIPEAAMTQGGLHWWRNDREVPDMWRVMFDYPSKDLAVEFNCAFRGRRTGTNTIFLGREATLEVHSPWCRVHGAEWEAEGKGRAEPEYEMKRGEMEATSHMRNFIDCMRSREETRCGVQRAWEEAATVMMSVESFRRERKVKWDAAREEIV